MIASPPAVRPGYVRGGLRTPALRRVLRESQSFEDALTDGGSKPLQYIHYSRFAPGTLLGFVLHPERPREVVVARLPFTRQTVPAIILLPAPDDWEAVPQLISKDYLLRHEAVVLRADWLNHLLKVAETLEQPTARAFGVDKTLLAIGTAYERWEHTRMEQGSNPVPSGGVQADPVVSANSKVDDLGSGAAGAEANNISEPPKKGKRGRPAGIKNGAGKKKPSSKKLARSAPKSEPSAEAKEPPAAQAPPAPQTAERAPLLQWIDRDKLVRGEPFSTLLPIRPETYEAIKASMLAKGFDPTHPAHVWDRDGLFTLVDGYTRDKAAGEVGITRLLAFVHHFQDETAALGFAIQCQTVRRNITDGEMFVLVGVYDKKVKPGSTQQRQEGGTFAPRASTDALGKSSKKTGDVLNTSATTVDRVRYLHKHADASTKAAVTNNKVTLSRACETVRKKLAAAAKAAKIHPETNGDAPKEKPLAFDATPESDIAFAAWHHGVDLQAPRPA